MSSVVVRARVDQKTKDEAAAVLASIGLTVSDAFRLMMVRIAKEKALPFEPLVPNKETNAAMREAPPRWATPPAESEGTLEVAKCGRLRRPRAFAATSSVRNGASTAATSTAYSRAPFTCSPTISRCRGGSSITQRRVEGFSRLPFAGRPRSHLSQDR